MYKLPKQLINIYIIYKHEIVREVNTLFSPIKKRSCIKRGSFRAVFSLFSEKGAFFCIFFYFLLQYSFLLFYASAQLVLHVNGKLLCIMHSTHRCFMRIFRGFTAGGTPASRRPRKLIRPRFPSMLKRFLHKVITALRHVCSNPSLSRRAEPKYGFRSNVKHMAVRFFKPLHAYARIQDSLQTCLCTHFRVK
jgi:hypothetical protein